MLVLGTGTGVGKTWMAAAVAGRLRASGLRVAARKPAQSFAPGDGATDAAVLARATGESAAEVCPPHRWYEAPMAPPMAAAALGRAPFAIADLVAEVAWPGGVHVGLVEGVGGVRSPLADDGDGVDLAAALAPDRVCLVTGSGLGAVNAVLCSVAPLAGWPVVVACNRFDADDEVHRRNRAWLEERAGLDVVVGPAELATRLVS